MSDSVELTVKMNAKHRVWRLTASTAKVCCLPQLVWLFGLVFMPMATKTTAVVQDLKSQMSLSATGKQSTLEDRDRIG